MDIVHQTSPFMKLRHKNLNFHLIILYQSIEQVIEYIESIYCASFLAIVPFTVFFHDNQVFIYSFLCLENTYHR